MSEFQDLCEEFGTDASDGDAIDNIIDHVSRGCPECGDDNDPECRTCGWNF